MRRRTFDYLATSIGAVLTIVLLVAGCLLLWGSNFTDSNVTSQLAQQDITFPPASAFAHPVAGTEITPSMIPSVSQYAGQKLTTGQQAEVWANDFIAVHLMEIGGGKTYAELSAESEAQPNNAALANQVQLVFRGTTLRGLLLEAYGFSVMGSIALTAAIAAFILAGIMLVLTGLGIWHFRRTPADKELLEKKVADS